MNNKILFSYLYIKCNFQKHQNKIKSTYIAVQKMAVPAIKMLNGTNICGPNLVDILQVRFYLFKCLFLNYNYENSKIFIVFRL